jgi:hypothetical protein
MCGAPILYTGPKDSANPAGKGSISGVDISVEV